MATTEKNYIDVKEIIDYINMQRDNAISLATEAINEGKKEDFYKYMERYITLGRIKEWLYLIPWKMLCNR